MKTITKQLIKLWNSQHTGQKIVIIIAIILLCILVPLAINDVSNFTL